MVQVLENKELYVIIPLLEEKAEKVENIEKKVKRKLIKLGKHAKQHEGKIDIKKVKNYADANVYRAGLYPR
ncbi:MAG: hypothetical protein ACFFEY_16225 [Candidatus Thorarchaeota archaeon]